MMVKDPIPRLIVLVCIDDRFCDNYHCWAIFGLFLPLGGIDP